jgi:hypothetical protein
MFKTIVGMIVFGSVLYACVPYSVEYKHITYSKALAVNAPKEVVYVTSADKHQLINNGAVLIGQIVVSGNGYSNHRGEPIDSALEYANLIGATHISLSGEDLEGNSYYYTYDVFILPRENWNDLPKNLQPK